MSPQTLAKLLTIFAGLIGLIHAGRDSNSYSYWKPDNSADFDEYEDEGYEEYQSLQSGPLEKQDFANPHSLGKFINGIQDRQSFGATLAPVSDLLKNLSGHQVFFQINLFQLLAGAIAVAGIGVIIYNDNLINVIRLNDENAKLEARIKALETDTGLSTLASRVAAVESSSSSSTTDLATLGTRVTAVETSVTSATTQAAANCAKLKEVTDVEAGADDAATIVSLLAVTSNTC